MDELVTISKEKFCGNFELETLILEWMNASKEQRVERANNLRPTDTDSGTFSGDDEDEMASISGIVSSINERGSNNLLSNEKYFGSIDGTIAFRTI